MPTCSETLFVAYRKTISGRWQRQLRDWICEMYNLHCNSRDSKMAATSHKEAPVFTSVTKELFSCFVNLLAGEYDIHIRCCCATDASLILVCSYLLAQFFQLGNSWMLFPEHLRSVWRCDSFEPWFLLVVVDAHVWFSEQRPEQVGKRHNSSTQGNTRHDGQIRRLSQRLYGSYVGCYSR